MFCIDVSFFICISSFFISFILFDNTQKTIYRKKHHIILLNNNLYFQRVTHLAKKKLIFHEALYELPPKNNTSIKYKDDLHVYKIIQTSWNTFKPTYTQAYFFT